MKESRWFPGAHLNYAEHCMSHPGGSVAIVNLKENGEREELNYLALKQMVLSTATKLRELGIKKGDRIAAIMPNCQETVVVFLAASAIGAVFSSCSPDFGLNGLYERLMQIEPKLLFSTDGYRYNQKTYHNQEKLNALAKKIPSIESIITIPYLESENGESIDETTLNWHDFIKNDVSHFQFESCEFNHPLDILYSSGTTGTPKSIVQGTGGTLLQHLKELILHTDLKRDDRLFYYTTCGWMMWNWSVSSLLTGASIVLYDGSPMAPTAARLFDICEQESVTIFGTSAKYISAIEKDNLSPKHTHKLESLTTILSTGSPLSPVSFDYVYREIKSDVMLASISGGTDIISCFALGCPIKPVIRGELQCIGLGMDVAILNEQGQEVIGEKGELVCKSPFPSMPVYFYNDSEGQKYSDAYFSRDPSIWAHGDFAKITREGGVMILGRSDAILNPGGVRIGTAEIYRQVEKIPEVIDSVVIGQDHQDDVRVILFVRLKQGLKLDECLITTIKQTIRSNTTPRHVPRLILQVQDIPKTVSGKTVELAVKNIVEGRSINNLEAIANPKALDEFSNREELYK
jgi:acetoacetyl-CoA synthetase